MKNFESRDQDWGLIQKEASFFFFLCVLPLLGISSQKDYSWCSEPERAVLLPISLSPMLLLPIAWF